METLIHEILKHPRLDLPRIVDPADCIAPFLVYCRLWEKWNRKIKLTSEHDPADFFKKHVFDSLQYARRVREHHRVLDIGAGGGFPGIPLKIVYPGLPLVLLESQRKKTGFLHAVGAELGLKDFRVVNARAEDAAGEAALAEQFDRVVFRAYSSTAQCLHTARPFLHPEGLVVIKKSLEEGETEPPADSGYRRLDSIPIEGYDGKPSLLLAFGLMGGK